MAEIVGGFLVPHDPLIFAEPDAAPPLQKTAVLAAFQEVAGRISELKATTAIIIGSDHYILFGPACLPAMLIAIGDIEGPIERIPALARCAMENNQPLARHLFERGCAAGFDWAVAKSMVVDHSIAIPQQLCVMPQPDVKTVPIYLNSGVEPLISMSRARALGSLIRSAILDWHLPERVVVIGSGGLSHWVGSADMGRVNSNFDRQILELVSAGNLDELTALSDEYLLAMGGNGAFEVRNFVCAMAAVNARHGRTIAYEAVPEWITGLGFAELFADAQAS